MDCINALDGRVLAMTVSDGRRERKTAQTRTRIQEADLDLLVAAGIGEDLGLPADALLPRLTAVTVVTGLREIYVTREGQAQARSAASELSHLVDEVLAFARAGLRGTRPRSGA